MQQETGHENTAMVPITFFRQAAVTALLFLTGCNSSAIDTTSKQQLAIANWLEEPEDPASEISAPDVADRFEIPNPERTNPFVAATTAPELSGDTIQLKGFVEVDKPKAILIVDNVRLVMATEESKRGIKLVEIRPPEVIYEHNGIQHSLSLLSM